MRAKSIAIKVLCIIKLMVRLITFSLTFLYTKTFNVKMEVRALHICVLIIFATYVFANGPQYNLNEAPELFQKFADDYKRNYKNVYDVIIHYEAFKRNLEIINLSNEANNSAIFDINKFADYTKDEIKEILNPVFPFPVKN